MLIAFADCDSETRTAIYQSADLSSKVSEQVAAVITSVHVDRVAKKKAGQGNIEDT